MTLDGLKIVIDCANGAAYGVAPKVLWELGAEVIELGTSPNGFNINAECGSTAPEAMRAAVLEHGADLGIALDGDADRIVLADERGELIDGDQMLALLAQSLADARACCAATAWSRPSMSNLGLERYLRGPRAAPASHPGRRSLRGRADAADRAQSRRRAVRPHDHDRLRHDRRRPARRRCRSSP